MTCPASAGVPVDAVLSSLAAARQTHSQILAVMEAAAAAAAATEQRFGSVSIESAKIGRLIGVRHCCCQSQIKIKTHPSSLWVFPTMRGF